MMAIHDFPRCAAYLRASNYRLQDDSMSDTAWAVCVSEAFTDEYLVEVGTVSFEEMDGARLLAEFEALMARQMAERSARQAEHGLSPADMERLKGFFGARGIKVSKFKSEADYWKAGSILWPDIVAKPAGRSLADLLAVIAGMPTKFRSSLASANARKIPAGWRA